jgi:hypothetical protein
MRSNYPAQKPHQFILTSTFDVRVGDRLYDDDHDDLVITAITKTQDEITFRFSGAKCTGASVFRHSDLVRLLPPGAPVASPAPSAWARLVEFWRTKPRTTLPVDSAFRKEIPVHSGTYEYFPAAMVCIALLSKLSNDKHTPGEPLQHARGKSMDHPDCIARHTLDLSDLLAHGATDAEVQALEEATCRAWRACAEVQQLSERIGAPLAPAAVLPK